MTILALLLADGEPGGNHRWFAQTEQALINLSTATSGWTSRPTCGLLAKVLHEDR